MTVKQYLASQLSHPRGFIGKFLLGSLWNKRNAALNEATLANLELQEEDRILDIGFGGGYLLERMIPTLKQGWVAGIDRSLAMVKNGRARFRQAIQAGRVDIQEGRAEALPYPNGHFNKVSSVNSIFYWDDIQQGIAEIDRILQAKGRVVLTFTCKRDVEKKWFVPYGVKTYREDEIEKLLTNAGFKQIKIQRNADRHREFICMIGYK